MKFDKTDIATLCAVAVIFISTVYFVLLLLFATGCGGRAARGPIFGDKPSVIDARCPAYGDLGALAEHWGMVPKYDVMATITTPSGIHVDPGKNDYDLAAIDDLVGRVDTCMTDLLPFHDDIMRMAHCYTEKPKIPLRECITVKIPDDWSIGCSGSQVLPWLAPDDPKIPDESCRAKGITPTKECPCRWRSGMQDTHTVVTTPNFLVFAGWYICVSWGCKNPWGHPSVAKCANERL